MKIVALYDGSLHTKNALRYGMQKIQEHGGELVMLQVFQSSLFVDYDAGPQAEAIARHEASRYLAEAKQIISEHGSAVSVRLVSEEGDPESELLRFAEAEHPDLILVPPRWKAVARSASCPVYIIPGTIMVPVDDSESLFSSIDRIRDEAMSTGSKVLLLGVIPIHLYSKQEKKELELVEKKTLTAIKKLRQTLSGHKIEVSEIIRSGYSDEEILKAAAEHAVSLILFPQGGRTPSELSKAAAIILEDQEKLKWPVLVLATAEAEAV